MITMEDHVRLEFCRLPKPKRRYSTSPWVCPVCHQAFVTTLSADPRLAPTSIHWRWVQLRPRRGPGKTVGQW
jgi:hypothetical protein